MNEHYLGVCIPYRDTGDGVRKEHLDTLVPYLTKYLDERNIKHKIFIGHQVDDNLFNRSGTKNAAFLAAKEEGCDYVAFHDVDMLPEGDVDYSYPKDNPVHIATYLSQWDYNLRDVEYFGGVVLFTIEQFEAVNGYHTNYWGWGMEDDDLFWRCHLKGMTDDGYMEGPGETNVCTFNGIDDHILIKSSRTLHNFNSRSFEIEMLVKPEHDFDNQYLIGDKQHRHIQYPIFSRSGWDHTISYTNSKAISNTMWTWKNEILYSWAKRYPNQWTIINIKVDDRRKHIRLQINGKDADARHGTGTESPLEYFAPLKRYGGSNMFLGRGNPDNPDHKPFKGSMAYFKITNHRGEVVLDYDFEKIQDDHVFDLSNSWNPGIMFGCKIEKEVIDKIPYTIVPHRRFGRFECLPHEDEGIVNGEFAKDTTQVNEKIYRLKMQENKIDIDNDEYGLRNMKYEIDSIEDVYENHKMINVRFVDE
jgi:xylosylprotein 4-beta-galactosyltransferase|tara:strand:+ start:4258 stop:5679 length:1422 start_codon:yes stop_codon:yes gene_type:complete